MIWIGLIAIGLIAGWMADSLTSGGGFGKTISLVLGLAGSLAGGIVAELLSDKLVGPGGVIFLHSLLFAAVGAIVFLIAGNLVKKYSK